MRYDTVIKKIFQGLPRKLLQILTGSEAEALLTVEYPSVQMRRPDFVARLRDGRILHLEFQSHNDAEMRWRMLEYYLLIRTLFGQPPFQVVIYLGKELMNFSTRVRDNRLSYRYDAIDVREIDSEVLLASDSVEDNLLSILCHNGSSVQSIRKILRNAKSLPEKKFLDNVEKLLILSGLRNVEEVVIREVKRMPVAIDLMENKVIRKYFEQGEQSGMRKGVQKGEAAMVRYMLEARFGKLPNWAKEKIESANKTTLKKWGVRLLKAKTLEEVLL
ncbi:MAG: hypothetical protein AB1757_00225 [Acidobacteriota bacterium]